MPIQLKCPKCGKPLVVKEAMVGKSVGCPKCKTALTVPSGDRPAAPTPQTAPSAEGRRQVGCPTCRQPLIVKDSMLGKKARCPKCEAVVQMPAAEQPTGAAPSALRKCCSCGKPLEAGAVFCVECGTDQRTGKKMTTDVEAAREPSEDAIADLDEEEAQREIQRLRIADYITSHSQPEYPQDGMAW